MKIINGFSVFLPTVMAVSLTLTLIIEIVVAKILKVKAFKNILNIILANVVTNPFVVSVSYFSTFIKPSRIDSSILFPSNNSTVINE